MLRPKWMGVTDPAFLVGLWVRVGLAALCIFLLEGTTFGLFALRPLFFRAGVFSGACGSSPAAADASGDPVCDAQAAAFAQLQVTGAAAGDLLSLLGVFVGNIGRSRSIAIAGALLVCSYSVICGVAAHAGALSFLAQKAALHISFCVVAAGHTLLYNAALLYGNDVRELPDPVWSKRHAFATGGVAATYCLSTLTPVALAAAAGSVAGNDRAILVPYLFFVAVSGLLCLYGLSGIADLPPVVVEDGEVVPLSASHAAVATAASASSLSAGGEGQGRGEGDQVRLAAPPSPVGAEPASDRSITGSSSSSRGCCVAFTDVLRQLWASSSVLLDAPAWGVCVWAALSVVHLNWVQSTAFDQATWAAGGTPGSDLSNMLQRAYNVIIPLVGALAYFGFSWLLEPRLRVAGAGEEGGDRELDDEWAAEAPMLDGGSSSSSSGGGVGMSMAEQRAETAAAAAPPPRSYARPAMAPAAERQLKAAASVDAAGASAADCAATPVDVAPNPLATGAGSRSAGAAGVGSHAATAASGGGSRSVVLMPMTGWKGVLACTLLLAVWCPMTLVRDPQALVAAYIGFAAFRLGIFATLYHHVLERYPPRVMLLLVNAESLLSGALSFVVEPIRDAVTARGPQVYPTINAAFLGVSGAVAVMALAILWRARGKAVPVHMPE